jgi:hypothetical protein
MRVGTSRICFDTDVGRAPRLALELTTVRSSYFASTSSFAVGGLARNRLFLHQGSASEHFFQKTCHSRRWVGADLLLFLTQHKE